MTNGKSNSDRNEARVRSSTRKDGRARSSISCRAAGPAQSRMARQPRASGCKKLDARQDVQANHSTWNQGTQKARKNACLELKESKEQRVKSDSTRSLCTTCHVVSPRLPDSSAWSTRWQT
eukprot:2306480-Pleurochrysis_carterae.AAC.2